MNISLEQFKRVHLLGREIVEAFDHPQLLAETVCRVASEMGYTGVGISLADQSNALCTVWTADSGRTSHRSDRSTESPGNQDDIVLWAVEHGVMTPDSGVSLLGVSVLEDAQSTLMVPIRRADRAIGMIHIESEEADAFDEGDHAILEFLASQVAVASEKAYQLSLERKKNEYLALVGDVGREISGVLAFNELCSLVVSLIHQHFAYSVVALYTKDPVRPSLVLQSVAGVYPDSIPQDREAPLDQGIAGLVARTGKPFLTNDARNEPYYVQPHPGMERTQAELCVPLTVNEQVIGVIHLQNTRDGQPLDEVDVLAMSALAGQVGIVLDNARLFQDLRKSLADQTQLQEQLIQSEKLSALGQLVAGIIHEINNPLTAVIGYADLELMRDSTGISSENLKKIAQESRRVAQIVRNLLAFARKEKPVREFLNLNVILHDIARIRAYNLRSTNIEVKEDYAGNLPLLLGDPNQLRQVFLNIITNAEHAIRKVNSRGWIKITTRSYVREGQEYVMVAVQDNGSGISSSHISRIFDPFFTTKKAGEGTGLGLSISYGIIKEHEGRLWAESPPNEGAYFYVELPVRKDLSPDQSVAAQDAAASEILPQRILVVDDEEEIATYLHSALIRRGHRVDTAKDGEEAWTYIQNNRYDVILTDLKMPGMTGFWLFERIRRERPDLLPHVIIMTGDVISLEAREFLENNEVAYIEKPFTLKQLDAVFTGMRPS